MFEPQLYQEKRSALNEILLQQLVGVVMRMTDSFTILPALIKKSAGKNITPQTVQLADNITQQAQFLKSSLQNVLEQYGQGHQLLRDREAARLIGDVHFEEGVKYADSQRILDFLKANVGRTYFDTQEPTEAPEGSIGTPGFHSKFKDWLAGLPAYDVSVSKDIVSGFYRDEMTQGPTKPLPLLVLRNGNEVITVLFRVYVSVMVLNLDHLPKEYNWENPNHYSLRGEMYTYRNNMREIDLEVQLAAALADQGITALCTPKSVQVERDAEEASSTPLVVVRERGSNENPCNVSKEQLRPSAEILADLDRTDRIQQGIATVLEVADDMAVVKDSVSGSNPADQNIRGLSSPILQVDSFPFVPEPSEHMKSGTTDNTSPASAD